MKNSRIVEILTKRENDVSLKHILDNSKASSGGERDVNFLVFLEDNNILIRNEVISKRKVTDKNEDYFFEKYKRIRYETDRHFLCRVMIQEELEMIDIETMSDAGIGNLDVLRVNSNYDIAAKDFSFIIDVGLTPARNFFRGLTDIKICNYLITSYFDEYMDDIVFSCFTRSNDTSFLDAVRDYEEGFKTYTPAHKEFEGTEINLVR